MNASNDLGGPLRLQREARGLSIAEAARRCGYHRSSIKNMERGNRNVLFSRYVRYAIVLGMQFVFTLNDAGNDRGDD